MMNNDDNLEQQIRQLRPAPLPPELKARLTVDFNAMEASSNSRKPIWITLSALAAAACVAFAAARLLSDGPVHDPPPLSVLHTDSTLLNTRTLAVREHGGRMWEIAEEEWRDDTVVLCSTSPLRVRSSALRHEIVCLPVEFH